MNNIAIETELGPLVIGADNGGITQVKFSTEQCPRHSAEPILNEAAMQLMQYFNGERKVFDLPLSPKGTEFQQQVWQQLLCVGYGETQSYQNIADAIGNPKAVRAVGMANGRNPIAIIVPCHRIIGSNGKLTGYAGGLNRKAYLLALESA